jgi:integrase
MLTNAAVKAARPRAAAYKLTDEKGLHLYVAPTNLRSWRWRFRWQGREQLLTIGNAFEMTLDEARARRDVAREQLARGEDPRAAASSADLERVRAFEYHARAWHAHMAPRWTAVHAGDVLASLERDVFPAIGFMPLATITPPVVLSALRVIEDRGRRETARRARQRISAVFAFAIAGGEAQTDPAAIVGKLLTPPAPQRHHPALLQLGDARALLAAVDQLAAAPAVVLASRFLALTAVRLACVRGARWNEIEDLDGPAPLWRIPAARMKMAAAKKLDATNDHLVPLSTAAVEVLRAARALPNAPAHIFPGDDSAALIGEGAIGALYDRAGFAGRHVPHGWRATFSTIMNELAAEASRGGDRAVIDRALAHAGGMSKVEAAYNRAGQLADRRRVFQTWADALVG